MIIAAKLISNDNSEVLLNTNIDITKEFVSVINKRVLKPTEKVPDVEIMDLKEFVAKQVLTSKTFVQKVEEKEVDDPVFLNQKRVEVTVYNTTVYPVLTYLIKVVSIQQKDKQFELTSNPSALKEQIRKAELSEKD